MNHLSRLLSILTILKSKRLVTGPELAERFGTSLRTIYRDIRKLEESGVPIVTVEGRGYTIMDGYIVAPIMFDEMEVNSLITAEKLISNTNDESLIRHFGQTLQKIKSVFKSSLQSQGEMLDSKMLVFKTKTDEAKSGSLTYIQMAITNFRILELTYQAPEKAETFRMIEPLAIYSYEEKWIVVGWCRLRNDIREFRLDRIVHFKVLDEVFEDRKFEFGNYFKESYEMRLNP